jgi:hypothetical protein
MYVQEMIQRVRKSRFSLIMLLAILLLASCHNTDHKIRRIKFGEFDMEGKFSKDSIPDGIIKYYVTGTNELVATRSFDKGSLNGPSINYFGKNIIQTVDYKNGIEFGFKRNFDSSSGFIKNAEFSYYGKEIGPAFEYMPSGEVLNFDFRSFENEPLYSVEYDSASKQYLSDKTDRLVNIHVAQSLVNNEKKLKFFFYNILPPKSKVTYKIYYMDQSNNIVDSVQTPTKLEDFFWEGYVDYPGNSKRLAFIVSKYDSVTKSSQTIVNYIKSVYD